MLSTLMRIAVLGAISGTQVSKLQILHYKYSRSTVKCPQKKFFLTFFWGHFKKGLYHTQGKKEYIRD